MALPFLAAIPAFWGSLGAGAKLAIGAGVAAAGAGATAAANKKRAKLQYDNMRLQQSAQQAHEMRQKANDERMAQFQMGAAQRLRDSNLGATDELNRLFDASLQRQSRANQDAIADDYGAKNNAALQAIVTDTPAMLGGQEQAAPEVKQAITKEAAKETSAMRSRVAALAKFGALTRDRNLENSMANSETGSLMGLQSNVMRGNNALANTALSMRPSTAYYKPAKVIQSGNDANWLGMAGTLGTTLGGFMAGGALGNMLTPATAATASGGTALGNAAHITKRALSGNPLTAWGAQVPMQGGYQSMLSKALGYVPR